jgi:hypothetical protein
MQKRMLFYHKYHKQVVNQSEDSSVIIHLYKFFTSNDWIITMKAVTTASKEIAFAVRISILFVIDLKKVSLQVSFFGDFWRTSVGENTMPHILQQKHL